MKPMTVRDLLLGLGLTAGLGGFVDACSSQDNPPSQPDNGNEGGFTGGRGGDGGIMGNGLGGAAGNAVRGGAPGQIDASDDVTSDGGNADAGDPTDVGSANISEDGG
jgi:hypothetical protein